jgi:hypothetical protein
MQSIDISLKIRQLEAKKDKACWDYLLDKIKTRQARDKKINHYNRLIGLLKIGQEIKS